MSQLSGHMHGGRLAPSPGDEFPSFEEAKKLMDAEATRIGELKRTAEAAHSRMQQCEAQWASTQASMADASKLPGMQDAVWVRCDGTLSQQQQATSLAHVLQQLCTAPDIADNFLLRQQHAPATQQPLSAWAALQTVPAAHVIAVSAVQHRRALLAAQDTLSGVLQRVSGWCCPILLCSGSAAHAPTMDGAFCALAPTRLPTQLHTPGAVHSQPCLAKCNA